ncbi:hypothetical protein TNCV_2567381 [Trichonephila clavipes]|uniref:Uncharacterized protein n=1 Tax=Trichonephila clavipes TaxID=2585209 RepID=A0A8X6WN71_TRICX|nr:hypothetical protein TNCV_2567381 [Trichonephila clavipes]
MMKRESPSNAGLSGGRRWEVILKMSIRSSDFVKERKIYKSRDRRATPGHAAKNKQVDIPGEEKVVRHIRSGVAEKGRNSHGDVISYRSKESFLLDGRGVTQIEK